MMEKLSEEEKFLLLGKITRSLDPDEEATLEILFRENPDALAAYEELSGGLPSEDVANGFARRQPGAWPDLAGGFRRTRSNVRSLWWWAAAAVFIGICVSAGLWWNREGKNENNIAHVAPAKKGAVELKMADGKIINLSDQQGIIHTDLAQLDNNNKELKYSSGTSERTVGLNTITVPAGLTYKINLADGTEVWLNATTKVDFPLSFPGTTREISIDGEAYLKVAANHEKPFIVHLPNSSVQVLGTEFNVNTYDSGIARVALVEGAVNVHALGADSKLKPGQEAVYRDGKIKNETFNAKFVLSWRQGLYYFNDAALTDIIKIFPRWYNVEVILDNPSIGVRRITGVVNMNRPVNYFLDDLKVIAGIESYFDKGGVLHLK